MSTPYNEELKLYNEALDQIITTYCKSHCLLQSDSEFVENINDAFYHGKIDPDKYYRTADSLFAHRKTQLPKCVMEYSPFFYASQSMTSKDMQSAVTYVLQDDFFTEHFSNTPMTTVIDTLLQNTTFDWKTISLPYMRFVAHDTLDQKHLYGDTGVGVIALSKIYFSKERDHAILFFEFKSSPNFQRGEIVFLEKTWGYWKAVAFRNIWIT